MNEESLFAAALETGSPGERVALLEKECAGDVALRQRVEALLRSHEKTDFLRTPAVQVAAAEILATQVDPPEGEDGAADRGNPADEDHAAALGILSPSDKPGSLGRLGHYEVQEEIGRGGMGVVLRAWDERLHRVVAIKVMAKHLATSATARRRFMREAQAAAAVSHDHIVTIHAVEEVDGLPYIAMQYVDGVSLSERIERDGPLAVQEILRIGMQTAAGLSAAHGQGVIHRDIKPGNILLENGVERVKITDFGLARAAADAYLTQTGVVVGTPWYMAPEQARGEHLDHRADLFSLGSVLYAACTGRSPFRADGTMAVLKRVCEDAPRPIREINPDIPDYLVAIIEKLLAKDPAERYQSAAEVAELLGKHLAHVQHPSVMPLPMSKKPPAAPRKQSRRRWAVTAAAILLFLVVGISLSEATGFTHVTEFVATVLRIRTPDGVLVVEVGDPQVQVTIEGDGGLVITGAGAQEVRLRPGSYHVHAIKDGQPVRLDRELVTITRGGKQVVKISLQAADQTQIARLDGAGNKSIPKGAITEVRRFEGDDYEVNGVAFSRDGGYVISAQAGTPSILVWDATSERRLFTFGENGNADSRGIAVSKDGQSLASTEVSQEGFLIHLWNLRTREHIRTLRGHSSHVTAMAFSPDGRFFASGSMDNTLRIWDLETGEELHRCSSPGPPNPDFPQEAWVLDVAFTSDGRYILAAHRADGVIVWDAKTGQIVRRFEGTKGEEWTVAVSPDDLLAASAGWDSDAGAGIIRLWDVSSGRQVAELAGHTSLVRTVRFSPDGRHLASGSQDHTLRVWNVADGREVCRVEDETQYPMYVEFSPTGREVVSGGGWQETGDCDVHLWRLPQCVWPKESAAIAEPSAFVLIGGKSVAERKFDTLAEAVVRASDGDTIEIRGNGPFISQPINIGNQALTIRAGKGFRPALRLSLEGLTSEEALLWAHGPLVLEGLEFERTGQERLPGDDPRAVRIEYGVPVHIANCRFLMPDTVHVISSGSTELRNCEFLGGHAVMYVLPTEGELIVDNCVQVGAIVNLQNFPTDAEKVTVRLTHNTVLADPLHVSLNRLPKVVVDRAVEVTAIGNVFVGQSEVFFLNQTQLLDPAILSEPDEAEAFVAKYFAWQGQRNLYPDGAELLGCDDGMNLLTPTRDFKSLETWKQFWASPEVGSLQGRPRFRGGDLLARLATRPEDLTLDDFRLRADSLGYRAGPDGKDLGADIDLVGPGEAYERWKQTPEYQEWLKETGQLVSDADEQVRNGQSP